MLALALTGGSWIFLGVVVVIFFAVVFGYYTVKGSGISLTPYRRDDGPPESPPEIAHDITQDVSNWSRGTAGHHGRHRPPATHEPVDPVIASALRAWRASNREPRLDPPITAVDHVQGVEGPVVLLYVDMASEPCRSAIQLVGGVARRQPLRLSIRHLPLADVHTLALPAAEALEAAAAQGRFFAALNDLAGGRFSDEAGLLEVAGQTVPDAMRLAAEVRGGQHRETIAQHIRYATSSGAHVVPEFYIDGAHYAGELRVDPLLAALVR